MRKLKGIVLLTHNGFPPLCIGLAGGTEKDQLSPKKITLFLTGEGTNLAAEEQGNKVGVHGQSDDLRGGGGISNNNPISKVLLVTIAQKLWPCSEKI